MTQRQNNRAVGQCKEELAAGYLRSKGYTILERNYRSYSGEIDLIAIAGNTIVFFEVKYRAGSRYGSPGEAVDHRKQQTIYRVAQQYMMSHGYREDAAARFDVISILGDEIRHYQDAFGGM